MRTVVLGPRPAELDALIARRSALGLDTFDEVWKGEYHMAPAAHGAHGKLDQRLAELLGPLARRAGLEMTGPFNLGGPNDFRVPDRGVHRDPPSLTRYPTTAIAIEIESPDDETWQKLDFYAACGVDEILIVSAASRSATWLRLEAGRYVEADQSSLLGPSTAALADQIDWPVPAGEE